MKNTVPAPNPFITNWLLGDRCKEIVQAEIQRALAYWMIAAGHHARTGREMSSARTSVHIGGKQGDRWIGELTVGGEASAAPYTGSDQFGAWRTGRHFQRAAGDLNTVLNLMAAL